VLLGAESLVRFLDPQQLLTLQCGIEKYLAVTLSVDEELPSKLGQQRIRLRLRSL
jgi:hypothetical protein